MAKTDYQDTAMNYVDDYQELLLRMESMVGIRLDQQEKEKEKKGCKDKEKSF